MEYASEALNWSTSFIFERKIISIIAWCRTHSHILATIVDISIDTKDARYNTIVKQKQGKCD